MGKIYGSLSDAAAAAKKAADSAVVSVSGVKIIFYALRNGSLPNGNVLSKAFSSFSSLSAKAQMNQWTTSPNGWKHYYSYVKQGEKGFRIDAETGTINIANGKLVNMYAEGGYFKKTHIIDASFEQLTIGAPLYVGYSEEALSSTSKTYTAMSCLFTTVIAEAPAAAKRSGTTNFGIYTLAGTYIEVADGSTVSFNGSDRPFKYMGSGTVAGDGNGYFIWIDENNNAAAIIEGKNTRVAGIDGWLAYTTTVVYDRTKVIRMEGLPTSRPSEKNVLWNDNGTLRLS